MNAVSRIPAAGAPSQSAGVTIIVVLVILLTISLLALGSMSNTNLQLSMVRNDQFYVNAYRVAFSEINAQVDAINANDANEEDPIILTLLELGEGVEHPIDGADLLGPHAGTSAFTQTLSMVAVCEPENCPSPPGFTQSKTVKVMRGEVNSLARLGESGALSNQSQAFWYLLPQSGITTFD